MENGIGDPRFDDITPQTPVHRPDSSRDGLIVARCISDDQFQPAADLAGNRRRHHRQRFGEVNAVISQRCAHRVGSSGSSGFEITAKHARVRSGVLIGSRDQVSDVGHRPAVECCEDRLLLIGERAFCPTDDPRKNLYEGYVARRGPQCDDVIAGSDVNDVCFAARAATEQVHHLAPTGVIAGILVMVIAVPTFGIIRSFSPIGAHPLGTPRGLGLLDVNHDQRFNLSRFDRIELITQTLRDERGNDIHRRLPGAFELVRHLTLRMLGLHRPNTS